VCTQKCLVAAASTILIRINWRWVNEVFHLHRIFNSHNCHEANLRASSVHYHQQCFAINLKLGIVHDFLIGPYLLHQQLSAQIYWVFWRKSYQNAGRNPIGTQEKHVVPTGWICGSLCQSGPENFSLPLNNDRWIGRGRPMAWSPRLPDLTPMDSFPWDHIKTLILLPVSLRRQQPVIVESHINLCCVVVGCLSRSVAICLNICSKLVWNTTFLQNTSVVLLYFQP
jgi:hypothetical protein